MHAAVKIGINILVITNNSQVFSEYYPEKVITMNFEHWRESIENIRKWSERYDLKAVIGVDEESIILAAKLSESLCIEHNSLESVKLTKNKYLMRRELKKSGLKSPWFKRFSIDEKPMDIFTELRTVLNKPTIYYLSLVVHNERSFHMPTGMSCPSNHLYLPLTKGGSVIKTENDRDLSFFSACKDIGMHAPELVPNWQERGKMWRKLEQYQAILVGNTSLITILPEPDTIYFHAEYRDD